jgi:hypothetical protein
VSKTRSPSPVKKSSVKRRPDGTLIFADFPAFRPHFLPHEVLEQGAFGGAYFRPIVSQVTGKKHFDEHKEFSEHFAHIDSSLIASSVKDVRRNKYKVDSGTTLESWESSGWIKAQDPYGW